MLRSIEKIKGFTVQATDGDIGKVSELFFDEQNWRVRYLVVDIGLWIFGRKVLIAPTAVIDIDVAAGKIYLDLTKSEIENSPEVSTDEPVSREKERVLHDHYQWHPYWATSVGDPIMYNAFPVTMVGTLFTKQQEDTDEEQPEPSSETSSCLRSTNEVKGYTITAADGDIGRVVDFLFNDESWAIQHMVVDTGNLLPGKKVLIAPPWIEDIQWIGQTVKVTLTQESVTHSPPFEESILDMEAYESQLLEHYREWFSYLLSENDEEAPMFLGKDTMGNDVISVSDGHRVGKVKDLLLSEDCQTVTGVYLGSEGLFSRQSFLVRREDIVTMGEDAILVKDDEVVQEATDLSEVDGSWLRRDDLQGRSVATIGGTKVGKVGDIVINKDGDVLGFSLSSIYVVGPIANNRAVAIHTVKDVADENGRLIVDFERAERQELAVA